MSYSRDTELCDLDDFDFSKIKQVIADNKENKENWPLYLVSFYLFFSNLLNKQFTSNNENETPDYPISEERYSIFSLHADHQHCYTKEDLALIQRIRTAHEELTNESSAAFFDLKTTKYWYDWWQCSDPAYKPLAEKLDSNSFTLPNRATKDNKNFPLWDPAVNMAKQIANWQSDRARNQPLAKKNDPVMLAFEEFAMWFFNGLADKECNPDVLALIAKRLSYVKHLIHLIPHFGPDRLHFLEIQYGLEDASKIISHCVANKDLSHFSTDIGKNIKDLELVIGNFLHLFPNEKVADNFSPEYLEGSKRNCHSSPLCQVFQASEKQRPVQSSQLELLNDHLGRFYQLVKPPGNKEGPLLAQLKPHLLDSIKFASFVKPKDKSHYLEAIATLDAMVQTRKILEQFHLVQSQVGNYLFSLHYVDVVKKLTNYHIRLINRSKHLIESLIKTSDAGLKSILSKQDNHSPDKNFENNLRMLDTKVAGQPTMGLLLEASCAKATESIFNYQRVMHELANDMKSGQANQKLEHAMSGLLVQMNNMNAILPIILGETEIPAIESQPNLPRICHASPDSTCLAEAEFCNMEMQETEEKTDNLLALSHQVISELAEKSNIICSTVDPIDGQAVNYIPMVKGAWDETTTRDRHTGVKIYTYRVYDAENIEIGAVDFYGHDYLCVTEDNGNNIIGVRGIFTDFNITPDMSVDRVCTILPPHFFDRVWYSVQESGIRGGLHGLSNIIGVSLQSHGYSKKTAYALSQLSFYSATMSVSFIDYYNQLQDLDETTRCCNALYYAALDTGSLVLTSFFLAQVSNFVQAAGDFVQKTYNDWLGGLIKKASGVIKFGLYANRIAQQGLIEGSAAILAGTVAEVATESAGRYALKLRAVEE